MLLCLQVKLYFLPLDDTEKVNEDVVESEPRLSNNDSEDSASIASGGNVMELSSGEDYDSLSETDDDDDSGWARV